MSILQALQLLAALCATLFAGAAIYISVASIPRTWRSYAIRRDALVIGVVGPFTVIVVMPTNHELLAPSRDLDTAETWTLLARRGRLHAARSVLSVPAAALYLWLLRPAH